MNATISIKRLIKRKLATAVLVAVSVASFATLGDGGKKGFSPNIAPEKFNSKNFSLRTDYNYRANHMFSTRNNNKFIMLNTVVTYQRGNATYVMPLKKKVLLDKIKFNPAPSRF
jgi:hypothetical protein